MPPITFEEVAALQLQDYTAEGQQIIRAEINRRQLTQPDLDRLVADVTQQVEKARSPMGRVGRMLIGLFILRASMTLLDMLFGP